jgi:hypothetical protein
VIKPDKGAFKRLIPLRNRILAHTPSTTRIERENFPLYYAGRKRLVYQRAVDSLCAEPISPRDAEVQTFIKAEKINFTAKPDPAPRVIQPRDPRYNVEVGCFLKPFEKAAFKGFKRTFGYNVVCKGLNATGVAEQLRENWDEFMEPVAIGLDASRFDQHVSREALEFEHGFYNCKFKSDYLATLLSWQLRTRGFGRAKDGYVKYSVNGCRMSGDMNTSLGNCIIMSCIVIGYFESVGVKARLANNGDDCVVICERKDISLFDGIDEWFKTFGFKLTREPTVTSFERIEFCQAQPVLTSTGWRMVRNIFTAPSKDAVSLLSWDNELEFNRWRNAIAECGLSLTRGVPIREKYYTNLWVPHSASYAHVAYAETGMGMLSKGVQPGIINETSRLSFYRAFGVLPDQQDAIESDIPAVGWLQPSPGDKLIHNPHTALLINASKESKHQETLECSYLRSNRP